MKIIKQYFEFIKPEFKDRDGAKIGDRYYSRDAIDILRTIETAGRTCYKSEKNSSLDECLSLIRRWIKAGHHSVLEHNAITVRIVTDRGVSHEIVRHRIASYSQESTRYCNYSRDKFGNEIIVILPVWFYELGIPENHPEYKIWYEVMKQAEMAYMNYLRYHDRPDEARAILPNSLKTEIVMTCNIREWRHFFTLRCSPKAHPQMRHLAYMMLKDFNEKIPVIFEDLL